MVRYKRRFGLLQEEAKVRGKTRLVWYKSRLVWYKRRLVRCKKRLVRYKRMICLVQKEDLVS